jgi:thioredoxin-related protein
VAKPSVDGLEEDLGARVAFTRVDIRGEHGNELAAKYRVRAVPTFLLVSPDGEVLYRKVGGRPDRQAIEEKLAALP